MHVVIVVLGDVGRSPRMQYHCQSLLDCGHSVTLVGYIGEDLIPSLMEASLKPRLRVVRLAVPDLSAYRRFGPLYFALRTIVLTVYLLASLLVHIPYHDTVDFVLVQNPPALPLLYVAFAYCLWRAFRQGRRPGMIIDWHNLGFSMLKKGSMVQKIAEKYERAMAPLANGHLCVTKAMKEFLQNEMKVFGNVGVLYDKPPIMFQPLDTAEQHAILTKLHATLSKACPTSWTQNLQDHQTLFTEKLGDQVRNRPGRPTLVTSSTSWTPDEDFGVLLEALEQLDGRIQETNLKILVVVTGKGPERSLYEERISRLQLQSIAVATIWLEASDYPKLLACADLGVSLHTSTTGLDLPMKILDLFGCETPVVAHDFECLTELVQDGVNGRIFRTSDELSASLYELLMPLSSNESVSNHSQGALKNYSKALHDGPRWHSNWMEHAFPVIMRSSPMKR